MWGVQHIYSAGSLCVWSTAGSPVTRSGISFRWVQRTHLSSQPGAPTACGWRGPDLREREQRSRRSVTMVRVCFLF